MPNAIKCFLALGALSFLCLSTSARAEKAVPLTCEERSISKTVVLVCREVNEPSIPYRDLASAFALLVSLGTAFYTYRKDRRARKQSIDDDYWIRKVIGPIAIEPLTKDIVEIATMLPSDCNSPAYDKAHLIRFMQTHQAKLEQHVNAVYSLTLIDDELCKVVVGLMSEIEESLLEYCGNNAGAYKTASGQPINSRQSAQRSMLAALNKVLAAVRKYQTEKI